MSVRPTPPAAPAFGDVLEASHPSEEAVRLLARRRSTPADKMGAPGPSPDQVDTLIRLAARVPDHGKLAPWRFVVFEGAARERAGHVLEAAWRARDPQAPEERFAMERGRLARAPVVVAVVSRAQEDHKIPEWEQVLSAGAVCQNFLVAASAMGFAAQWLSEWYAYDSDVRQAFGLAPGERVAGYIYLGSALAEPQERVRKDVSGLVQRWAG